MRRVDSEWYLCPLCPFRKAQPRGSTASLSMEFDMQVGFVDEGSDLISNPWVNLLLDAEKEFLLSEDKMGLLCEAKQISANVQVLQRVVNALD